MDPLPTSCPLAPMTIAGGSNPQRVAVMTAVDVWERVELPDKPAGSVHAVGGARVHRYCEDPD
jgi:hypothetical protein